MIGEISTEAVALVEVTYENGQAVFVAKTDENAQRITALNADTPTMIRLKPRPTPGQCGCAPCFRWTISAVCV